MCTSRAMVSGSRGITAGIRVMGGANAPGEPNLRLEQPKKALPIIAVKHVSHASRALIMINSRQPLQHMKR
jgi:hypothetical protein